MKTTQIIACMAGLVALAFGVAVIIDQSQDSGSSKRKTESDSLEMQLAKSQLEFDAKTALAVMSWGFICGDAVASAEDDLKKQVSAGEAQLMAIRLQEAMAEAKAADQKTDGAMKTLKELEGKFKGMEPSHRDLIYYCVSDDLKKFQQYAGRVYQAKRLSEIIGEHDFPNHDALLSEKIRVTGGIKLKDIRTGNYESGVLEEFEQAHQAWRDRILSKSR